MRAELEFGDVGFRGERKTGREPREKTSEQGETQQQTQPPYHGTGPESNPGLIGGRRTLSPLRHPYSPQLTDRTVFYLTQKGTVNKPNNLSLSIHFSARFIQKLKGSF